MNVANQTEALSVTAALDVAKASLEGISLSIIGEVSELSDNPNYRAVYFTLSDQSSALPCVIWRNVFERQGVELRKGMLVEAGGRFTLYAAKGRMNFDVRTIKPAGEGDLRVRVAALARKLEAEGLMSPDKKLDIPRLPERIGLVTSPSGKAVHDVLRTLRRRWPSAHVLFAGVTVEGETAPAQMIEGLKAVQAQSPEVILLVRGGGSYEDLMPFNDEGLARAVAASPVPIVTGIGHEPDTSIVDMVADFRASTPTAAAERVSPDQQELLSWLAENLSRIDSSLLSYIKRLKERLDALKAHPLFTDPTYMLRSSWVDLEHSHQRLLLSKDNLLSPYHMRLSALAGQLDALSPIGILARGYALVSAADKSLVRSIADTRLGDNINIQVNDGTLLAEVLEITAASELGKE
ncbi:MAG: exodeoxyribonuclease VII large subunit [Coriobacteriia bacterium]|nr:exodeoxyribonuclease VII large subunit [Coriobacteriia bacterium]